MFPVLRLARRDGKAAVAGPDRRDPVPAGGSRQRVPGELRIHVRMDVNEARSYHLAVSVHGSSGRPVDFPDLYDLVACDCHVPGESGPPRTVNNPAILDEKIICHGILLFALSHLTRSASEPCRWVALRSTPPTVLLGLQG